MTKRQIREINYRAALMEAKYQQVMKELAARKEGKKS